MELFKIQDENRNLLPIDGEVYYFGKVFDTHQAKKYFEILKNTISWENDSVKIFGKIITTQRKIAWYSTENQRYSYSGSQKIAHEFTKELWEIKSIIEELSGETYNACLLNLYHAGQEGMGWHSDNEKEIVKDSTIASLSLGVQRKFSLKHKQTKETVSLNLEAGSLLIMKGTTQVNWLHSLPKTTKVAEPRINLTFRKMIKLSS